MKEGTVDGHAKALREGATIQFEGKGYFRVDEAVGKGADLKMVLFKIPTGSKH